MRLVSLVADNADDFYRLSKALKHAGETELRKALHKSMREAAKPLVKTARDAALDSGIPASGGLAARISKAAFRAQVRTGATTAGVRITAPGKNVTVKMLNTYGKVRHPVRGNRSVWVDQPVPAAAGWFDKAMQEHAPEVRDDLVRALEAMAEQIMREAR